MSIELLQISLYNISETVVCVSGGEQGTYLGPPFRVPLRGVSRPKFPHFLVKTYYPLIIHTEADHKISWRYT